MLLSGYFQTCNLFLTYLFALLGSAAIILPWLPWLSCTENEQNSLLGQSTNLDNPYIWR